MLCVVASSRVEMHTILHFSDFRKHTDTAINLHKRHNKQIIKYLWLMGGVYKHRGGGMMFKNTGGVDVFNDTEELGCLKTPRVMKYMYQKAELKSIAI